MPKTSHTPGPWVCHFGDAETTCNCRYVFAEYGGMGSLATVDVCEKMDGDWGDDNGPAVEVAKANARLIAAAPDLYAALSAAVEYMAFHSTASGEPYPADKCRAALAKARGQT